MNRNSLAGLAAIFALVLPATARADTFWDFIALNGAPASEGSPSVGYSSRTVTNSALGSSVNFSAALAPGYLGTARVVFNWFSRENNVENGKDEKGVGICRASSNPLDPVDAAGCYEGSEIGDSPSAQWLILDLTGLVTGTILKSITLASLNVLESFYFEVCSSSAFTTCSAYFGTSTPLVVPSIWVIDVNSSDQSWRWVRFKGGLTAAPGYNGGPGGYGVQGITTDLSVTGGGVGGNVVPEPATMGLLATGLVALAGVGALRRRRRTR
jgi:hypothetical protein